MIYKKGLLRGKATTWLTGGMASAVLLVAGACGGDHVVALPTNSGPGAPGLSMAPTYATDAVRNSYTRYWAVLPQAEHTANEARRRQILADYSTEPQLSIGLRGIRDLHAKGLTSAGYVVVHIKKVKVNGDTATVEDCQDSTKALIQRRGTGKSVSRGVPNDHIRATLSRGSDGQWRISRFAPLSQC